MIQSHKIKLNPSDDQRVYFAKAAGTRRFVYNWGLAEWQRQYAAGEKPNAFDLKQQFNKIKKTEFPWAYEVSKSVVEGAFMDLGAAYQNFFEGRAKYPKFKRKKVRRESFYLANDRFKVNGHFLYIPKLGWVNMSEALRLEGKLLKATIKQDSVGDWYASISVELPEMKTFPCGEPVGIDLGVLRLATLSDGSVLENQKPLRQYEQQVKQLSRSLARKQKDSKRREKTRIRLAKAHRRISRIRLDIIHKATTQIVNNYSFIGLEDLYVKGMMQNHCLAKALSDAALGLFRDILVNKAVARNITIQLVGRFFPSSKWCSNPDCDYQADDLPLSERLFICPKCGLILDRDLNAAVNIRDEALRLWQVSLNLARPR